MPVLLDGVDGGKGETQESIAGALSELVGEFRGKLDGLVLNREAANGNVIAAAVARGGAAVAVGNLPRLAGQLLEGGRLGRVKDSVALLGGLLQLGGKDLCRSVPVPRKQVTVER